MYIAKATDVSPCWPAATKKVLLVQPSSAAAEWVFSLLNDCFSCQQQSGLQDYGTAQEQVNIRARVGTRNKAHEHANLSHTRGASQTTHAIHEVHLS